ncbi:MAG TPA: aminoacyl-tRNA hydrolase [Candidatus Tetragenococcus pullicola]|nr:aminoacyl-tRNA hydrolase [Candidatus Tetragenococcus pullicola]
MKMIVGLGNPGQKYLETKHNVGFMVVDQLADHYQSKFKKNTFEAEVADFFVNGEKILLVKPQTFMNDSGRAVGPLMTYFGIYPEELVVIQDDLDLELGKIRLRQKGSAGGHNGLKSIISSIGTNEFKRIKIGIGHPQKGTVVHHVLQSFAKKDQQTIDNSLSKACDAAVDYIENNNFMKTMNAFN